MASPQGHNMWTRNKVTDLWPFHEADRTLANKLTASPETTIYILPWGVAGEGSFAKCATDKQMLVAAKRSSFPSK
jgi:hypothetical protein